MSLEGQRKTTEQRAEIARHNGALSRGPVTPAGKERSSKNAVKHGIYTRNIVLENESPELYLEMRDKYLSELAPVGERETDLALDIVNARWRLSRLMLIETATIDCAMSRQKEVIETEFERVDEAVRTALAFTGYNGDTRNGLALIGRAEGRIHRILQRTTAELERLQTARRQASEK